MSETLSRRESHINQVHDTFQQVLMEIQSMKVTHSPRTTVPLETPFATGESSTTHRNSNPLLLKLAFPKFDGIDPSCWVYKAEQFYSYNGIFTIQQVSLASYHVEGLALQWF